MLGRQVANLVDEPQAAGRYAIRFNAHSLPSGLYFYRIETPDFKEVRKMMLVR
jgi:hypothetical protein